MRVSKGQILRGLSEYIQGEILPQMSEDKAVQIIMSVAVNAALANNRLVDAALENGVVKTLLDDDGSGTYEIDAVAQAMRQAIERYGGFPVRVPAIPLISPREITLRLDAMDVDAMKRRIEDAI